jgi:hypothetical protein
MLTAAAAGLVGLVVGLATGGRTVHVAEHRVRSWGLLVGAVTLQSVAQVGPDGLALAAYLVSYGLLGAFAVRNLHLVGIGLVATGLALNAGVMLVNGGMPVRPSAAEAAGVEALGAAHHLEGAGDVLMPLADVIPFGLTGEVLSFGDLVFAVGLADVVAHALRPRPQRSAHRRPRAGGSPGSGRRAQPVELSGL